MSCPQAAGESVLALGAPPPPSSLALISAGELFRHFQSLIPACVALCPFLHTFTLRCHSLDCGTHLCPARGLFEPAVSVCVQQRAAPGLSSQRPQCSPLMPAPCSQCLLQCSVCWLCRFFIVHADGSGTELLRGRDVHRELAEACRDPTAAVLQEPVQEHPGRKAGLVSQQN